MKKILLVLSGAICCLFSISGVKAQETPKELPIVTVTAKASIADLNQKISRAFNQMYPNAADMKWYKAEKNYLVEFIENHRQNTAVFEKSGAQVYHIRFGYEADLPENIRDIVKTTYYDQTINHVYKVEQNRRNIWIISMEDPIFLVMARVENDEIEETQRITKAPPKASISKSGGDY